MPKQLIDSSRAIRARLRNIENEYLSFHAAAEEHDRYVRFTDSLLPSMYSCNCAVLKEKLSAAEVREQIGALLAEATCGRLGFRTVGPEHHLLWIGERHGGNSVCGEYGWFFEEVLNPECGKERENG